MKSRLLFAAPLLLSACGGQPPANLEVVDEAAATGVDAANLGRESSVWPVRASLRRCGSWALDEDFSSGRYDAHRYALSVAAGSSLTIELARTRGAWQPALVIATADGEQLFDGQGVPSTPSFELRVTAEESGRSGERARVVLESGAAVALYVYTTSWEMIDAEFAGGIPRTAEYSLRLEDTCEPQSGSALYRGLTLDGSELPRAGLANATLRRALGVRVEPHGEVRELEGRAFVAGTISSFGGPNDSGVSSSETGAISGERLRSLNNPLNPSDERLASSPEAYYYAAMRFDYAPNGRSWWAGARLLVIDPSSHAAVVVRPVDWGPNTSTGRLIDLAPQVMEDLGLSTDDEVYVAFADPSAPLGALR